MSTAIDINKMTLEELKRYALRLEGRNRDLEERLREVGSKAMETWECTGQPTPYKPADGQW